MVLCRISKNKGHRVPYDCQSKPKWMKAFKFRALHQAGCWHKMGRGREKSRCSWLWSEVFLSVSSAESCWVQIWSSGGNIDSNEKCQNKPLLQENTGKPVEGEIVTWIKLDCIEQHERPFSSTRLSRTLTSDAKTRFKKEKQAYEGIINMHRGINPEQAHLGNLSLVLPKMHKPSNEAPPQTLPSDSSPKLPPGF